MPLTSNSIVHHCKQRHDTQPQPNSLQITAQRTCATRCRRLSPIRRTVKARRCQSTVRQMANSRRSIHAYNAARKTPPQQPRSDTRCHSTHLRLTPCSQPLATRFCGKVNTWAPSFFTCFVSGGLSQDLARCAQGPTDSDLSTAAFADTAVSGVLLWEKGRNPRGGWGGGEGGARQSGDL